MRSLARLTAAFVVGATGTGLIAARSQPDTASPPTTAAASDQHPRGQTDDRIGTSTNDQPSPYPPVASTAAPPAASTLASSDATSETHPDWASPQQGVAVDRDDHLHGDNGDPDRTVAARVAVAMYSWRFDDDAERLSQSIADATTDPLRHMIEPSAEERERRRTTREVSSAIVLEHHVDGARHELVVARRWFSDVAAATSETRHLRMTVVDEKVTSVAEARP